MKEKHIAGLLALFLGSLGIHRFYLGQPGLGFLYIIFAMTGISTILGFIDAYLFFSMDEDRFDIKYNRDYFRAERVNKKGAARNRNSEERPVAPKRPESRQTDTRRVPQRGRDGAMTSGKVAELKKAGIAKYKDYDFEGAIEDFTKSLQLSPNDVAVHFNLACAFSLTEQAEKAFHHLDQAVGLGFNDFDRIKTHDALAFLRIQPEFLAFEQRGYRIIPQIGPVNPENDLLGQITNPDLLLQLRKLEELRGKGLLTDEEYAYQRRKITG
jgi:TM2 domain-containing membrane protein YozV